jgi:predicted nucleotide-binding protein (sugar kinase/HSP70/actin superfamily)
MGRQTETKVLGMAMASPRATIRPFLPEEPGSVDSARTRRQFRRPVEEPYRADERGRTTILIGGLTWRHHELVKAVFECCGHRCEALPAPDLEAFQLGKDNCNNGECNPTYFTVGSLIQFLKRKQAEGMTAREITEGFVHFTVGSCGPCRHGMYEAEYRFALRNAGFEGFRISLLNQSKGLFNHREEPGLEYTLDFAIWGFSALMLADLLGDMLHQIRPYEVNAGETERVFRACVERVSGFFRQRRSYEVLDNGGRILARPLSLHTGVRDAVRALAKLWEHFRAPELLAALQDCRDRIARIEVDRTRVKPVVKITGEFYSQTTESLGNYHMFAFLEGEGAQAMVESVACWVTYLLHQAGAHWRSRRGLSGPFANPGRSELGKRLANRVHHEWWAVLFHLSEQLYSRLYRRLARGLGGLAHELSPHADIARLAHPFYNTLTRGGEGHQEVGKNIYYTSHRLCHMVLSLKPFGCMPSQLSDGVQSAVVSRYPEMVFLPVETSGDGEVHALSRVQMALSEAKARAKAEFEAALASTGKTLEQIRAYAAAHAELRSALYAVPHRPGVAGVAASYVLHLGDLMDGRRSPALRRHAGTRQPVPSAWAPGAEA